jgi:hypothetical protein
MCGIVAGLLPQPLNEKRLDAAIDFLYHRGHWFFGHTGTSIIGLNNGQQPMSDRGSDAQVVVNGARISSKALDEQSLFDPTKVRAPFSNFKKADPSEQLVFDSMLNRVVSFTLMHERFGMS